MSSFPETPHQSRTRESLDSVSPLTATPSTLPPSTGRRTPRGRGQPRRASAAFSPAFSSMSVRGELAMGGRGDVGGRSSNSTGRRGSGGNGRSPRSDHFLREIPDLIQLQHNCRGPSRRR